MKTIRGVLYVATETGPASLRPAAYVAASESICAEDSASPSSVLRPAKTVSGIENAKVYALHDPDNFVFTDSAGKFELSVDMEKFKQWLGKNGIPSINDGSGADLSEQVTIIAEKKEKQSDGSELTMNTAIPVDCKNKIVVQLEDLYDKELHSQVKVRYSGHCYGVVTVDGLAAGETSILFYETSTGQIAYRAETDSTGAYSVFPPPGHYRLVVLKNGCEPATVDSYEVKEKGKRKDDFNLKADKKNDNNSGNPPVISFTPGVAKAPELSLKLNGTVVQNGQVIEFDQNSNLEVLAQALDNDSGLGTLIGSWNSADWFRITANRQYSLNKTELKQLSEAGMHNLRVKVADYDMISTMSPAQTGYFRVEVPQAGDAAFLNSIGIIVKKADGTEKYRSILIPDANNKVGAFSDVQVSPGDQVVPYIHVNTRNRTPREYDRLVGQFDSNNRPVWQSTIGADGIALIGFEDLVPEFKPDYDYNDVYFKAWFVKEPVAGAEVLAVSPVPSHQIEISCTVKVRPVLITPVAPINLAVTAGNASATLSWNSVSGATSYNAYYSTSAGVTVANGTKVSGVSSPAEITGLTNGHTYYFIVTAVNAGGESAPSNEVSATPQVPAPVAPINLAVSAGNASATLSWNSVSGATSYNAYYSTSAGVTVANGTKASGVSSPAEITGLTNGQTYYFIVTAVNAGGESAPSNEVSAKPQVPAPVAPINLAVTAGNASATLSWNSVSGATSYNAYYSTSAGVTVANGTKVSGVSSPAEITGLTNGQIYYFIVTAVNAGGESAPSNEVSAKPQVPAPVAPINLAVTAGNASATLSWNSVSGATNYNAYYSTSAGVTVANGTKVSGVSSPAEITGLTNGQTYYFIVTAVNAGGESAPSNEVSAKPQVPAPVAPINLAVTAGNASATLSWNSVSGATSYNAYYSTSAGVTVANGTKVSGVSSPAEITGLTNGQTYYFIVTAVNAGGESAPSNEVSAKPQVPAPGAPINLAVTAGNASATLSWNSVSSATSYNAYYSTSAGVTVANGTKVSGVSSPAEITGLTNGQTYYFIVTAVNAGGESAPSNEVSAKPQVPAPVAPINLAVTAGNASATLSWNSVSGATSYNAYYSTSAGVTVANGTKVSGVSSPAEITGLTNGQTYYFIVTAVNAGGESAPSNEVSAKPQVPAPGVPENLRVEIETTTVKVYWDAVAGADGYNLYWLDSAGVTVGNSTKVPNAVSPSTFENVPAGARYFRVSAFNAGGESSLSNEVKATIIAAFTSLLGSSGSHEVNDMCSDNDGNVYVTGYTSNAIDGQPYIANPDYFLIKYDMNGSKTWVRMGGSSGTDKGMAVCADSTGVYLLGRTDGTVFSGGGGRTDFFIVKYDFTGNIVWSKQYGTGDYEEPGEMAIDSTGLYVTGSYKPYVTTTFSETKAKVVLWKFDLSGNAVYSYFDESGYWLQSADSYGIAVQGGKVFQTVHQTSTAATNINNINTRLMRFDAATGAFEKRIDRNNVIKEYLGKIAADSTGVYVTERRWDSAKGYYNLILVKYDTELTSLWSRSIDPLVNASLSGVSCLEAKVYVGGNVNSSAFISPALGGSDGYGLFYGASGTKFGEVKFGGATNETVGGVVKTPYGLYFAGTVQVTSGNDIFLKKH